VLWPLSR
ncbi:hypothetical protein CFC21_022673, partial [Triticum aestivum]